MIRAAIQTLVGAQQPPAEPKAKEPVLEPDPDLDEAKRRQAEIEAAIESADRHLGSAHEQLEQVKRLTGGEQEEVG